MPFADLVAARRSVRMFDPAPIPPEAVRTILDAANRAPSAGNLQAYEIYLVTTQAVRDALTRAALDQGFIAQAPMALVFCAHPARAIPRYGSRGEQLYAVQDATIACTFAMLSAQDQGLATVWVGAFADEQVRRAIDAPPEHRPVAILPIGRAAEPPRARPRRDLADLVHER